MFSNLDHSILAVGNKKIYTILCVNSQPVHQQRLDDVSFVAVCTPYEYPQVRSSPTHLARHSSPAFPLLQHLHQKTIHLSLQRAYCTIPDYVIRIVGL
jgi:hypothetical protein